MNKLTNKENKIKEILQSQSMPIDVNEVWNEVENRIRKPKKQLILPLWLMMGISFLMGGIVWNLILSSNETIALPCPEKSDEGIKDYVANIMPGNSINLLFSPPSDYGIKHNDNTLEKHTNARPYFDYGQILPSNFQLYNPISPLIFSTGISAKEHSINTSQFLTQNENAYPMLSAVDFLSNRDLLPLNNSQTLSLKSLYFITPIKKFKGTWVFGIQAGINKSIGLDSMAEIENSRYAYLASKEQGEYGYHVGATIGRQILPRLRASVGMSIDNQVIKFENHDTYQSYIDYTGTKYIYINENGNEELITGQTSGIASIQYDTKKYRQHTSVDVNLRLQYALWQKNRWTFSLNAGIDYGLYSFHRGYYFDDSIVGLGIISKEANIYQKTGLRLVYGCDMSYRFKNFDMSLSPYYSKGNEQLIQSNKYNVKNSQLGILFGLSIYPSWE